MIQNEHICCGNTVCTKQNEYNQSIGRHHWFAHKRCNRFFFMPRADDNTNSRDNTSCFCQPVSRPPPPPPGTISINLTFEKSLHQGGGGDNCFTYIERMSFNHLIREISSTHRHFITDKHNLLWCMHVMPNITSHEFRNNKSSRSFTIFTITLAVSSCFTRISLQPRGDI